MTYFQDPLNRLYTASLDNCSNFEVFVNTTVNPLLETHRDMLNAHCAGHLIHQTNYAVRVALEALKQLQGKMDPECSPENLKKIVDDNIRFIFENLKHVNQHAKLEEEKKKVHHGDISECIRQIKERPASNEEIENKVREIEETHEVKILIAGKHEKGGVLFLSNDSAFVQDENGDFKKYAVKYKTYDVVNKKSSL